MFLIINELQNNAVTFMQQKRTKVTMFFVSGGGATSTYFMTRRPVFYGEPYVFVRNGLKTGPIFCRNA